jgi:hypothetical protein
MFDMNLSLTKFDVTLLPIKKMQGQAIFPGLAGDIVIQIKIILSIPKGFSLPQGLISSFFVDCDE